MVTRSGTTVDKLDELINKGSRRWNLKDQTKRAAWQLYLNAQFADDKDAKVACKTKEITHNMVRARSARCTPR